MYFRSRFIELILLIRFLPGLINGLPNKGSGVPCVGRTLFSPIDSSDFATFPWEHGSDIINSSCEQQKYACAFGVSLVFNHFLFLLSSSAFCPSRLMTFQLKTIKSHSNTCALTDSKVSTDILCKTCPIVSPYIASRLIMWHLKKFSQQATSMYICQNLYIEG